MNKRKICTCSCLIFDISAIPFNFNSHYQHYLSKSIHQPTYSPSTILYSSKTPFHNYSRFPDFSLFSARAQRYPFVESKRWSTNTLQTPHWDHHPWTPRFPCNHLETGIHCPCIPRRSSMRSCESWCGWVCYFSD